jgi:hypothetical protein
VEGGRRERKGEEKRGGAHLGIRRSTATVHRITPRAREVEERERKVAAREKKMRERGGARAWGRGGASGALGAGPGRATSRAGPWAGLETQHSHNL